MKVAIRERSAVSSLPALTDLIRAKLRDVNSSWSEELACLLPTVVSDAAVSRMSTYATSSCPLHSTCFRRSWTGFVNTCCGLPGVADAAVLRGQFSRFVEDPLAFLATLVHTAAPGHQEVNVRQWLHSAGVTSTLADDLIDQFLSVIDQRPPFIVLWTRLTAIDASLTDVQYCQLMGILDAFSAGPVVRTPCHVGYSVALRTLGYLEAASVLHASRWTPSGP
jgi:hypothetical protein